MNVRPNTSRTFAECSATWPEGGVRQPRPVTTLERDRALGEPVTSHQPVIDSLSCDKTAEMSYDEWLAWLDETCALVRRLATRAGIEYHRERLAELEERV